MRWVRWALEGPRQACGQQQPAKSVRWNDLPSLAAHTQKRIRREESKRREGEGRRRGGEEERKRGKEESVLSHRRGIRPRSRRPMYPLHLPCNQVSVSPRSHRAHSARMVHHTASSRCPLDYNTHTHTSHTIRRKRYRTVNQLTEGRLQSQSDGQSPVKHRIRQSTWARE